MLRSSLCLIALAMEQISCKLQENIANAASAIKTTHMSSDANYSESLWLESRSSELG